MSSKWSMITTSPPPPVLLMIIIIVERSEAIEEGRAVGETVERAGGESVRSTERSERDDTNNFC